MESPRVSVRGVCCEGVALSSTCGSLTFRRLFRKDRLTLQWVTCYLPSRGQPLAFPDAQRAPALHYRPPNGRLFRARLFEHSRLPCMAPLTNSIFFRGITR